MSASFSIDSSLIPGGSSYFQPGSNSSSEPVKASVRYPGPQAYTDPYTRETEVYADASVYTGSERRTPKSVVMERNDIHQRDQELELLQRRQRGLTQEIEIALSYESADLFNKAPSYKDADATGKRDLPPTETELKDFAMAVRNSVRNIVQSFAEQAQKININQSNLEEKVLFAMMRYLEGYLTEAKDFKPDPVDFQHDLKLAGFEDAMEFLRNRTGIRSSDSA